MNNIWKQVKDIQNELVRDTLRNIIKHNILIPTKFNVAREIYGE